MIAMLKDETQASGQHVTHPHTCQGAEGYPYAAQTFDQP